MFNPGLVYDAELFDYFAFLCTADPSIFVDAASTCGSLEAAGVSTETTDLNVPSIGASSIAGSITVQRTITSVADKRVNYSASVEAPAGFSVSVSPDRVRLNPGESAVVDVTIVNETSPVDVWAFGALTWSGGGYEVRSPIAAKAALFSAPDGVSGTGVDGSVEIPVEFGFSGPYTAAPHGPVKSAPLPGSVDQDPDQTFDPNNLVGTAAIPITVSGSAFLRLSLDESDLAVPNPDVDIDLYLYDSAGNEVASSTAGGTAELIELTLPADDTYTLYVHGWQTLGGTVEFAVQSWDVPLAAGTGALTVEGAPSSVSIGDTATLIAAWSGLDAGEEYVGAVSHSNSGGLIGLTLVEITT